MGLDMCCGMGNFFNHLPNLYNVYGFDIDPKAVAVARYLYPDAHIETCDIRQYNPSQRVDIIVGNPPFNLRFDYRLSQKYYMDKAYSVLNPAGLLMLVVPCSFLQSVFWEKTRIAGVNEQFSFVGQTRLPENAFAEVGVERFATKIMVFLRASDHIEMKAYCDDEFVPTEVLCRRIAEAREMKRAQRLYLLRETANIDKEELEAFEYRLAKYLYELKAHARLREHLPKAEALVAKFRNQRPPDNCTNEEYKKWEKNKLTTAKVLAVIRRYISRQNVVPRKEVALVKNSYGFKLKAYAPRLLDKVEHRAASIVNLVSGQSELPMPSMLTEAHVRQIQAAKRLNVRKQRQYERQEQPFEGMTANPALVTYLDRATFVNKEHEICRFTELQKHDLNRVMQKRYALLNWQQGSGKTAAVYHQAKYLLKYGKVRNAIVLAPAIVINMTWRPFLDINGEHYRQVRCPADLDDVPVGVFLVVSTSLLAKLKRPFMRFVKLRSRQLALVFDESDEITNPLSARTRYVLSIFRRLKYKILDTGATTRNNIGELYSQFELLYNNSANMICWSTESYHENKEREVECDTNPYYGQPFPAFRGHTVFKSCHCPGKASVFGIEKQNQDVYNKEALAAMIAKTCRWFRLSEYSDMAELHAAFGYCCPEERTPRFRFREWTDIPDELVREDWLSPNLFEVLDALSEIDNEDRENFLRWCRQNGYDIAMDDVAELATRYLSIYGDCTSLEDEPPDEEDSPYVSDYRSDMRRYATDIFDDDYD